MKIKKLNLTETAVNLITQTRTVARADKALRGKQETFIEELSLMSNTADGRKTITSAFTELNRLYKASLVRVEKKTPRPDDKSEFAGWAYQNVPGYAEKELFRVSFAKSQKGKDTPKTLKRIKSGSAYVWQMVNKKTTSRDSGRSDGYDQADTMNKLVEHNKDQTEQSKLALVRDFASRLGVYPDAMVIMSREEYKVNVHKIETATKRELNKQSKVA